MTIELKELIKKLNPTEDQLKELDGLQESFNQAYKTELESNASGLKTKNQELISKLKEAKENAIPDGIDLAGYQDYVKNIDQIEADKKKAEEDKLIATENWNKLKNDITNNHETTIKALNAEKTSEISELKNALDSMLIENVAIKEIDSAKGSHILLMPHVKSSIQTYKDENGNYDTKVVDSSGKDRMNLETGENFTVKELVAEFQANKDFAGAFPVQNNGSNTNIQAGNKSYNATNNPFDKSGKGYSLTEQARLMKTNPTLAKQLKDSA